MKSHKFSLNKFKIFLLLLISFTFNVFPQSGNITILHTNDLHGHFEPEEAEWVEETPKPLIGGMATLEAYVRQEENDHTLILDGGDFQTGTPISTMETDDVSGGGFIQMMNRISYDAMTIGNHDFDLRQDNLKALIERTDFDVVCANLFVQSENDPEEKTLFAPGAYRIYQVGNIKVGVIGLIMNYLDTQVFKPYLKQIVVDDPARTAQTLINQIDPETDLIVLLTHMGVEADTELAANISHADVIVGAHSHTLLQSPEIVNNILIVQAGKNCRNLGRLDLTVAADTVSAWTYRLIPLWTENVKTDPEMEKQVACFHDQIEKEYGEVIGQLYVDWIRSSSKESNIGNFITDVMRETCQADFAVINSGGIRKNLKAGPITKRDIVEILPFSNAIVRFHCSGKELLKLIQTNAKKERSGSILQISGLKYKIDKDGIQTAAINGRPIRQEKNYTGVTVDYVIMGNSLLYMGFEPETTENLGEIVTDVVIRYIKNHPHVSSKIEGRMQTLK